MIFSFFASKYARAGAVVAFLLGLAGWFAYDQQRVGARKVLEKSRTEAKRRNAKSAKIRKEARKPGAADRLLRDYCRDC